MVAEWMRDEFEKTGEMYQEDVVDKIRIRFGSEFVYENENGNMAISRKVLKEFRRLTEETAIWERSERYWRKRTQHDPPGRRQAD